MRTPEAALGTWEQMWLAWEAGRDALQPLSGQGSQGLSLVPSFDPGCQTWPTFCQG